MVLPPNAVHPEGEANFAEKQPLSTAIEVETFAGKVHVEWDPTAAVTPIGQLPSPPVGPAGAPRGGAGAWALAGAVRLSTARTAMPSTGFGT